MSEQDLGLARNACDWGDVAHEIETKLAIERHR